MDHDQRKEILGIFLGGPNMSSFEGEDQKQGFGAFCAKVKRVNECHLAEVIPRGPRKPLRGPFLKLGLNLSIFYIALDILMCSFFFALQFIISLIIAFLSLLRARQNLCIRQIKLCNHTQTSPSLLLFCSLFLYFSFNK